MVHRNKPADCIRMPLVETLPTQCQQLRHGYGECKRGLIDMRKRFRGNKPISISPELEGGGGKDTYQLYAGKPAVSDIKPSGERNEGPAEGGERVVR